MIVHVFPAEKFTEGYIQQICDNFCGGDHTFIVYGNNDKVRGKLQRFSDDTNIIYCSSPSRLLLSKKRLLTLARADKVVVHGIFSYSVILSLFLFIQKTLLVCWGGEIYEFSNEVKGIKEKCIRRYKKYYINHVKWIATLVQGDFDVLKQWCSPKGEHYLVQYSSAHSANEEREKIRNLDKPSNPVYILVGNSAAKDNNHIKSLQLLSRFSNENIEIIVPLSYGGPEDYVESVIEVGKKLFGDKFVPIRSFMEISDYWSLLNKCKVGVFNNDRQQAMGNINSMAILGAKVYIRSDTVMWNEFVNMQGMNYFDIEEINNEDFNQFWGYSIEQANENYRIRKEAGSVERFVERWSTVFNL